MTSDDDNVNNQQRKARMDIEHAKKKYGETLKDNVSFWLVDSSVQKVFLINSAEKIQFPVSTAKNGLGNREGSFKTPTGLHKIHDLIGKDAHEGMIFVDRKEAGRIWDGTKSDNDMILTRIITLQGCEENINKGSDVDTLGRNIYIHGTNAEDLIGAPASHGCIRMKNRDIVEFFDSSWKGMFVVII